MTAKERLRERIERLSEEEAERLLGLFEDPVVAAFRDAPLDDEPWTEADEAAMAEVEADRAAGAPTIPRPTCEASAVEASRGCASATGA